MWEAITRGARDGAIINEYLRSVFITAQDSEEPIEPDVTATVHFSGTYDGYLAMLWAHWYDSDCDEYRQEVAGRYIVDEEAQMSEYRRFLGNWEEEAMTTRLKAIKKAVRQIGRINGMISEPSENSPSVVEASKRGPGRPRKKYLLNKTGTEPSNATATVAAAPKRGRGRPRKNGLAKQAASKPSKASPKVIAAPKRGRGRLRKKVALNNL